MNKLISFSILFVCAQLSLFSLNAQPFQPQSPATRVREVSPEHLCYAINNQFTIEISRQVAENNVLKFEQKRFDPILLGRDPSGALILIGKYEGQKELVQIPIRFIRNAAVLETKNFVVTQQMKDQAAGMVSEVICGP